MRPPAPRRGRRGRPGRRGRRRLRGRSATEAPAWPPLGYVAAGGFVAARGRPAGPPRRPGAGHRVARRHAADRASAWSSFATLIVLSRHPARHPGDRWSACRGRRRAGRRPAHRRGRRPARGSPPQVPARRRRAWSLGAMLGTAGRRRARQLPGRPFTPAERRHRRAGRRGRGRAGRPGDRLRRGGPPAWPATRRRCGSPGTCRARSARFALAAPVAYAWHALPLTTSTVERSRLRYAVGRWPVRSTASRYVRRTQWPT